MDDVDGWLTLEMKRDNGGQGPDLPFRLGGRPFLPRASLEVHGGTPETLVLIAYEPSRPGDPAAGGEMHSSLVDQRGHPAPAGAIRLARVPPDPDARPPVALREHPEA